MHPLRTIKVFLASSEEMENDRNAFGNLIRRLDDIYRKRGIHIELFEWEDTDAAYCGRRKQDEYNDEVRSSDMFIALFHRKAGAFTLEEFDVAIDEFEKTQVKPKPYVYCRVLCGGETDSAELAEFKRRLFEEMGHYWVNYSNKDSLCLHFVMQLQMVEGDKSDRLKAEGGEVTLDGVRIAGMDKLSFVADNPDYQRMSRRLEELPALIEKTRLRLEKYPDDEEFQDDLQRLLDERNQLQVEFDQQQTLMLETAQRIARLQGERITERMRRAIDAFERGDVREANVILDEAERDAARNLADYRQSKEITEQKRQTVIHSIEELLLKASTLMADATIAIQERIDKTAALYAQADEMASEVDYDKEKYQILLYDYSIFLYHYGRYKESLAVNEKLLPLTIELFGEEHGDTSICYNNIGLVLEFMGEFSRALPFLEKALAISISVHGEANPEVATTYNNIGLAYEDLGNYTRAMESYRKALSIFKKTVGEDHSGTATAYDNIGRVYGLMGDHSCALEYMEKDLAICEKVLGDEHPDTATACNNIGTEYCEMGDYPRALQFMERALAIWEKVLGEGHPNMATCYNNIGLVYDCSGDYPRSLEYTQKSLALCERILGDEHPDTASSYNNIGLVYEHMGDWDRALEFYLKSLAISEKNPGPEHPDTATCYSNIGLLHHKMGDDQRALEYLEKALVIREKKLGDKHPDTCDVRDAVHDIREALSKA